MLKSGGMRLQTTKRLPDRPLVMTPCTVWKLRSRRVLFFAALQQLLDTGTQLQMGEWLGNVIVKPTFETLFHLCMGDLSRHS